MHGILHNLISRGISDELFGYCLSSETFVCVFLRPKRTQCAFQLAGAHRLSNLGENPMLSPHFRGAVVFVTKIQLIIKNFIFN